MANIQIRIEDSLRDQAQQVANDLGMDLTTAVRIFLKQMVSDRRLPFRPELDPFYSPNNQSILRESIEQGKNGLFITKSLSELKAME